MAKTVSKDVIESEIRKAIRASLFSSASVEEPQVVKSKPKFNTACWSFSGGSHKIFIGLDLFKKDNIKPEVFSNPDLISRYVSNHYFHELAHAMYTVRDFKPITRMLKALKAPFSLWNLFEDAWIEHRTRTEVEYSFKWLEVEQLVISPRPESILFALIQSENDFELVSKKVNEWSANSALAEFLPKDTANDAFSAFFELFNDPSAKDNLTKWLPRVYSYYLKMIAVSKSEDQVPLIRDWIQEFGAPPESPSMGLDDVPLSVKFAEDSDELSEFEGDTVDVLSSTPVLDPTSKNSNKAKASDSTNLVGESGQVLHRESSSIDMNRVTVIANKFSKVFEDKVRLMSSSNPSKKMSARHFAVGRKPFRVKGVTGKVSKSIFLEVDCSGSMGGFHASEGRLLVAALSVLAAKGKVSGHVALSAVSGDKAIWQTFKLPMTMDQISHIQGWAGAEGLEGTLKGNLKLAREADLVLVYTDGSICDVPINKSDFHKYGIYTWGVYVGNKDCFDELNKYFDKALIRQSTEDLVDAMLVQI